MEHGAARGCRSGSASTRGSRSSAPSARARAPRVTALGDIVNVAARLASAAGPGELLVTAERPGRPRSRPANSGISNSGASPSEYRSWFCASRKLQHPLDAGAGWPASYQSTSETLADGQPLRSGRAGGVPPCGPRLSSRGPKGDVDAPDHPSRRGGGRLRGSRGARHGRCGAAEPDHDRDRMPGRLPHHSRCCQLV